MAGQGSNEGVPISRVSTLDGRNLNEHDIVARIERLPMSFWHLRAVGLIGLACFFGAFDSLTIAFVMPVLPSLGTFHRVRCPQWTSAPFGSL